MSIYEHFTVDEGSVQDVKPKIDMGFTGKDTPDMPAGAAGTLSSRYDQMEFGDAQAASGLHQDSSGC